MIYWLWEYGLNLWRSDSYLRSMVTIKQGYWLPLYFRISVFIAIPIVVASLFRPYGTVGENTFLVLMLLIASVAVTARNFIELDMTLKTYREYYWLLGFRTGETLTFDSIEKLFINKVKLVQELNKYGPSIAMATNAEVRTVVYKCFLKFSDGEKILLDSDADKIRLIDRLKGYNKVLKTTILDTSSHEVIIIE